MKKISHKQFLSFIFSQPRERKIKMFENIVESDSECGCMMVHLARNKGFKGKILAGHKIVMLENETGGLTLEKTVIDYFPYERSGFNIRLTYGEVQDFLIKKGEKNPLLAEKS